MSLAARRTFWIAALLGGASLLAQGATNHPALAQSPSSLAPAQPPGPPPRPSPMPPLPPTKPPIAFFRELLAMTPLERKKALADRPPQSQALILAKVREYELLPPDERELRLRVTELRWYLVPLLSVSSTNRATRLAMIPDEDRTLIEDRLQAWDKLPPEAQKVLLENQTTLSYLAEIEGRTDAQRQTIVTNISPARRALLERGIKRWSEMSPEQQQETLGQFREFFELSDAEKDKALRTLSEPERRQIEKTLQTFGHLPAPQRDRCIRSFAKFASLSLQERQQFLKDAERWKQMTPAEREAWRDLVKRVPPLPWRLPPMPPPPLPRSHPAAAIVTNGN